MTRWLGWAIPEDDGYPYCCQAHPRPDESRPVDDVRRDVAFVAWAIAVLLLIVFLSSWLPFAPVVVR